MVLPRQGLTWKEAAAVLLIVGFFAAVLWPVGYNSGSSHKANCMSNMKQNSTALIMYAQEYDDLLPHRDWMDASHDYCKNWQSYTCTEVYLQDHNNFGHAFDSDLSGKAMESLGIPAKRALVYDSNLLHKNAAAPIRSGIMKPGRHNRKNNIGFLDGHVKSLFNGELASQIN